MATQARQTHEQVGRRMVSVVAGAVVLATLVAATPAAAYLQPSKLQVKYSSMKPPASEPVGLSGGFGQRPARFAQAPSWQSRVVGREAALDVFLLAGFQNAEALITETVMVYVDGHAAGTKTLQLRGHGVMQEILAMRVMVHVGDQPQLRQVQVVVQGQFSCQRTFTMML